MAALGGILGRDIKFYKGDIATGTVIVCRTKSLTIGNESIDVTSDNDDGFRTLMAEAAQKQIDMSVEGVIRQDDFLLDVLDPNSASVLEAYTINIPFIGEVTGNFRFSNIEVGAPYNDSATFSSTVESSGRWDFTPNAGQRNKE